MKKHFNIYTLILSLLFAAFAITGCANLFDENETDTYCTIIFDGNGGTTSDGSTTTTSQRVPFGQKVALNKNPFTRANYAFIGWTETKDKTEADFADEASLTFTRSMTLYAVWSSTDCVVTFHNNIPGVADETVTQTFTSGVAKKLLKNSFTRDGFAFVGWATAPNIEEYTYTDEQTIPVVKNMDLYVIWGDLNQQYTVKFYMKGADPETATPIASDSDYWASGYPMPTKYFANTDFELPSFDSFSKDKMNSLKQYFAGWHTDSACSSDVVTKLQANTTAGEKIFYANFKELGLYVASSESNPAGNDTTGNGTSAKPYLTLAKALTALNSETLDWTIYVVGAVKDSSTTQIATGTTLKANSLTIVGTTGSGTDSLSVASGTPGSRPGSVISVIGDDTTKTIPITFSKLTITGGNIAGDGGGIKISAPKATVNLGDDCIVSGNTATSRGGGIYIASGNLTIGATASIGINGSPNTAANGGGIYNDGGTITMTGGTIGYNTACADGQINGDGGGVYNASGIFNMSGGNIVLNKAGAVSDDDLTFTSRGGGIYNKGTVNLSGNAIIGVATQASSSTYSNYANEYGGGIYNIGSLVFADSASCSIQGNFAKSNGGGLWYSSSSTFTSNTLTDVNNTLTDTRITLNNANSGKQIKKD